MKAAASLTVVALLLASCSDTTADPSAQLGKDPKLPAPRNYLLPPMKIASPEPWQGDAAPSAAAGLKVAALARGLKSPRFVYPLPNGDVLVVESKGPKAPVNRPKDLIMGIIKGHAGSGTVAPNRITLLRDADGDGVAEARSIFLSGLNSPFGVVLVGSDLYIADIDAILRVPYVTGQTRITARPVVLTPLPAGPINHHWTKDLTASPDGSKLYVGIGSNSNIVENGMEAEQERARIWEVDRATGAHRVFATGLRNPNGLTFEPTTGALFAVVNERDEIGPDLVPDYLTSVRRGGFYGWPYSYYGRHLDPRVAEKRPDLVARAIVPDYALSSHVAPLGLAFGNGATALPARYRAGAFVGEHGSWDRSPLNGYKVVFVPFVGGKPSGKAVDAVTGFLSDDQSAAHGRPVGLAVDRRGALLIADDLGNTVWRVTAA